MPEGARTIGRRIHDIVDGGRRGHRLGRVFDVVIGVAIAATIVESILATDSTFMSWLGVFAWIEWGCALLFLGEYVARVWACPYDRLGRYSGGWRGRLRYMASPMAIVDLVSFAPTFLALFIDFDADLLILLRTIRLLKILRYFAALETLANVIRREARQLLAAASLMALLLIVVSTLMHLVEKDVQPDKFGSVPQAMWWGIVTLSTVGYGDAYPVTPLGKLVGALSVVLGIGMFALPAGIVASGFAEEMRRRNFIVTWSLVANVPFFAKLPALRIADIAARLEPHTASRKEIIFRRGDAADAMYFVLEGTVEIRLPGGVVKLESGEFFGEMALLSRRKRSATVVAHSFCQFLRLRVAQFDALMLEHPDLADEIHRIAAERRARIAEEEG